MRHSKWVTLSGWLAGLALALGAKWAGAAGANDVLLTAESSEAAEVSPAHASEYWIGLECVPVEPALRSQLGLAEHQGVMVARVMPESPAAKAGIKPYDVLVKAGDKPLRDIKTLVEAVEQSKDKPLSLEVLRGGKSQKVDVAPAKRPGESAKVREELGPPPGGSDLEQMRKWIEKMHPGVEGQPPMRFRFLQPGVILPPNPAGSAAGESLDLDHPQRQAAGEDHGESGQGPLGSDREGLGQASGRCSPPRRAFARPWHTPVRLLLRRDDAESARRARAGTLPPEARPDVRLEKRMEALERRLEQMRKTLDELHKSHPEAKDLLEKN